MRSLLIHAWTIHKSGNKHYLPYTHWVYLKEIAKYFDDISFLSAVLKNENAEAEGMRSLDDIGPIKVISLPYAPGYVSSIRYLPQYIEAYKNAGPKDVVYTRYPIPFGWLSKKYLIKSERIIHFVGDPMDAAKNNPNFSGLKKLVLTKMFLPEHLMYMWACKGAKVFTNGYHLKERLKRHHIDATALISSTLNEGDYFFDADKAIKADSLKLLYIGYLRKAKGIETVIKAFEKVLAKYPYAELSIVGSGESEAGLKQLAAQLNVAGKVKFWGHVEDRALMNNIIRSHDIFCFGSLSEGSPRVVLEAMANGINVLSTPVGSLPFVFEADKDILYADFNNADEFYSQIDKLVDDAALAALTRKNAYDKVKEFTIQGFIRKIFE